MEIRMENPTCRQPLSGESLQGRNSTNGKHYSSNQLFLNEESEPVKNQFLGVDWTVRAFFMASLMYDNSSNIDATFSK
jgi:hypothetical protein